MSLASVMRAAQAQAGDDPWRGARPPPRGAPPRPPPPPPPPRTKWTRRVPRPVLIGHAASLTLY